ncbi:NADPH-dependent curcumin reductase CurA [Crossiella equi]|uniref:NADPH-dependent curcumin reductase CurA n=1 Tax=Crossiella equi TaxID=130796 RepID=A0ABS5ASI0_9PSEU|nr:NADP-dependent oxidoreductase [Crossiella equi]MBP2479154.1 NADPH-dependent curcumin reductase CurA [Crossiella equi]
MTNSHREVRLRHRPEGEYRPDCLELVEAPLPVPGPGQALVRNLAMRVGAETRTRLAEHSGLPMPPYQVGLPLDGPALGEVVTSDLPGLAPGDLVQHRLGWREYAVVDGRAHRLSEALGEFPLACLSSGFAGWLAVTRIAPVRPGDVVFVSGAAGGVGVIAGQFARLCGAARVLGSVGSAAKAERLVAELGFDEVLVRGTGPFEERLRTAAPEGLDVVVDTVGGEQLEAALRLARPLSRYVLIGALASQTRGGTTAPFTTDALALFSREVSLRGVTTAHHRHELPDWELAFGTALREGTISFPHTTLPGLDQAPRALAGLLAGQYTGTVLVTT